MQSSERRNQWNIIFLESKLINFLIMEGFFFFNAKGYKNILTNQPLAALLLRVWPQLPWMGLGAGPWPPVVLGPFSGFSELEQRALLNHFVLAAWSSKKQNLELKVLFLTWRKSVWDEWEQDEESWRPEGPLVQSVPAAETFLASQQLCPKHFSDWINRCSQRIVTLNLHGTRVVGQMDKTIGQAGWQSA